MCSWGNLWTIRYKKTKKPKCHLWRNWSKNRMPAKQGTAHSPCTQHHQRGEQTPLGPTPGHNPALISRKESDLLPASGSKGTCYVLLLTPLYCSMSPNKALPEFCLPSSQFLLIEEGQELWLVSCWPPPLLEQFLKAIPEPIPGPQSSVRHWIIPSSQLLCCQSFFSLSQHK